MRRPDVQTVTHGYLAGAYDLHDIVAERGVIREAGFMSGGDVEAVGGTVLTLVGGDALVDGGPVFFNDQNVPDLNGAGIIDATNPRWILLEIDGNGVAQLNLGTPAPDPLPPVPTSGRPVAGAFFVSPGDTRQAIAAALGSNQTRYVDLRQRLPKANEYALDEIGLTVSSTPDDVVTAFWDLSGWIQARDPRKCIVWPAYTLETNASLPIYSGMRMRAQDPMTVAVKLADDTRKSMFDVYIPGLILPNVEVGDVWWGPITIDGNRYGQNWPSNVYSAGSAGIVVALSNSGHRHDFWFHQTRILRASEYAFGLGGAGFAENITWYEPYIENAGSDGMDVGRADWPFNRNLRIIRPHVNGFGFFDDYSSAAIDVRGEIHTDTPYVPFVWRNTHHGFRFRVDEQWDGPFTAGNGYGAMYASVVTPKVACTGTLARGGVYKSPNAALNTGCKATDVINMLPTPRVVSFLDYTVGGTPASPASSFTMGAWDLGFIGRHYREPQPWRTQMLIVAHRASGGATPNSPSFNGGGLTWVAGDPLRPGIESTRVAGDFRLSVLHALPTFDISDAKDWSAAPQNVPATPASPITSGALTSSVGTLTFTIGTGVPQTQVHCMAMWVEVEFASVLCGLVPTTQSAPFTYVDYGAHGADMFVQSVSAAPLSTGPYQVTLNAFDVLNGNTGVDGWGNPIYNVAMCAVYNMANTHQLFTPKAGYLRVGEVFSAAAGSGRTLSLIYKKDDTDPVPGGTLSPAGAASTMLMGIEVRTGR